MHKSSFLTKILAIVAVWWGIQIFFWFLGVDIAAAATLSEYVQDKIYVYNSILNGLYLLIRPALALAGFALDNSMVYGSLFGLDAPLFLIWNIIKNIANFILWFMVLFEILKNFFTTGEQGKKAFEVIKKALIAWVLIQASWFLMGAVIDISTIATYSIGGMPIAILGWEDNQCKALGNIKTLPIGTKVDFTASNADYSIDNGFQYYYYINKTGWTKSYFSPCEFYNDRWVIGQKFWRENGGITYVDNYCILPGNQFAYFTNQIAIDAAEMGSVVGQWPNPDGNDPIWYRQNIDTLSSHSWWLIDPNVRSWWLANNLIFDARSWAKSEASGDEPGIYLLNGTWGAVFNAFDQAPMLKNIIGESEWFVGVLITLYKSVLNFVSFNTGSSSTDTFILFLEALLKVWFGLALLIPLTLLSIALVIRVGYIWMFIALSPIIALKIAFEDNDTMKWIRWSIPIIKEKLSDVLRIIFAPVIITFAVSFCLVFMTALITSINNQPWNSTSQCLGDNISVFESMNIKTSTPADGQNKTYQIAGIAELQQSAFGSDITGPQRDIFGWVLINLFGVAIVWLLLMTTIDSVFKWTPIGDLNLGTKALKMMSQIPIIPIPMKGGWWTSVWAWTLASVAEQQLNNVSREITAKQEKALMGIDEDNTKSKDISNSDTNTTTTNSIVSTIGETNTWTVATAVAVWWLWSTVDMTKIEALKDNAKKYTSNEISKAVATEPSLYEKYTTEVNKLDDSTKKERWTNDAKWINTNKAIFNKDEFKTILGRPNDELAKRLTPQADKSKINLGWDDQVITFTLGADGIWQYVFDKVTNADKSLPDYSPLIDKTSITDRSQPIAIIRTP